jgi:S-adenosylmethionine decarboxylase
MESIGRHLMIELWDCAAGMNDAEAVREALLRATDECGATLLHCYVHKFDPQGVTGMVVISESHISIHTWPEAGYVAIDAFTCGDHVVPEKVVPVMERVFKPRRTEVNTVRRGVDARVLV